MTSIYKYKLSPNFQYKKINHFQWKEGQVVISVHGGWGEPWDSVLCLRGYSIHSSPSGVVRVVSGNGTYNSCSQQERQELPSSRNLVGRGAEYVVGDDPACCQVKNHHDIFYDKPQVRSLPLASKCVGNLASFLMLRRPFAICLDLNPDHWPTNLATHLWSLHLRQYPTWSSRSRRGRSGECLSSKSSTEQGGGWPCCFRWGGATWWPSRSYVTSGSGEGGATWWWPSRSYVTSCSGEGGRSGGNRSPKPTLKLLALKNI